jgi:hypothetical protein
VHSSASGAPIHGRDLPTDWAGVASPTVLTSPASFASASRKLPTVIDSMMRDSEISPRRPD